MEEQSEVVKRALGYPYAVPSRSYIQIGERTLELGAVEVDLASRVPLLAYGSNAAPEVLASKLVAAPDPVPLLRAALSDLDVVYSAHVSRYGAVPATLHRSRGTVVNAFVAYVTSEQLRLISNTEPNYELATLSGLPCRLESGGAPIGPRAFLSRHGCLRLEGSEVALTAIEARNRRLPAMDQRQVLARVRDILRPDQDLERFIVECVERASHT